MQPKMCKKWIHRKLEAFGIYRGREAHLSPRSESGGAQGQKLQDTFRGDGSERVCRIRSEDDQCYRRTSSIFFRALFFGLPAADGYEIEL